MEKEVNWNELLIHKKNGIKNLCVQAQVTPSQLVDAYKGRLIAQTSIDKRDLFVHLLNQTLTEREQEYIDKVCVLPHRDNRTATQYATDLTVNWLLEDLTTELFNKAEIPNKKSGADSNRDYLDEGQITSACDFKVKLGTTVRNLEVIYDHTNYWYRQDKLDLRLNKHNNLANDKALLLGIDTQRGSAFVIDYHVVPETVESYHEAYGKTVHSLVGIKQMLQPISVVMDRIKGELWTY